MELLNGNLLPCIVSNMIALRNENKKWNMGEKGNEKMKTYKICFNTMKIITATGNFDKIGF